MTTTREELLALTVGAFLVVQGLGTLATVPRRLANYGTVVTGISSVGSLVVVALGGVLLVSLTRGGGGMVPGSATAS